MAFPHPQGLLPSEAAFLCEMELVTVIPRQRLERLDLLGGPTNALIPPQRANLPLWLALLLKRQKRANISPPPWLQPDSLRDILELETVHYQDTFSPAPFASSSSSSGSTNANVTARDRDLSAPIRHDTFTGRPFLTSTPFVASMVSSARTPSNALPYHWFELAEMLLHGAPDDLVEPDSIRGLLRDLREIRLAKMRKGVDELTGDPEGVRLDGVGAMEISESRGFITGVVDGLRKIGTSREQARREREEEDEDDDDDDDERTNGRRSGQYTADGAEDEGEDEDMT